MLRSIPGMTLVGLLLGSCAGTQQLGQVRDDVYYLPSTAPPVAVTEEGSGGPRQPTDDYFDEKASSGSSESSDFYDVAYNDPYYYNYGRFGFNASMGWQTGWNGSGWGMGMGWGTGYDPWYSISFGWGSPYYHGSGYGWNDPWYGYGYGGYYGPYGSCYCCYTPVIIGGSSGVVYGHRPSVNGGGVASTDGGDPGEVRATFRDPVGLAPNVMDRGTLMRGTHRPVVSDPVRSGERPTYTLGRAMDRLNGKRPAASGERSRGDRNSTTERSNDGGSDRSGSYSSPRSTSGGGNSGGSSGGGSRSGGGGRPR